MYTRVHPHEENNDGEEDVRLSQRRGPIKTLIKNKEYEKYKCHVCKNNEPYYQCPTCKLVVCSECTINNNICKYCFDYNEKEKNEKEKNEKEKNEKEKNNLVWFKNTNGKYKKWCFCCMNK